MAQAESAADLILYAYNINFDRIANLKDLGTVGPLLYDIVGKVERDTPPTKAEFPQMMQELLADRFKLRAHRETREMPVYFLTVGKNGPKFRETPGDAAAVGRIGVNGRNQTVTLRKASMAFVAQDIKGAFFLDRPVLDRTGLTGLYDVNIEATPEFRFNKSSEPGDVSVFTAVQEQLGLKLQPGRAQIEVLVIDHIEKPADN